MAWIEKQRKKYYVIDRVNGKVTYISHGLATKAEAVKLRDKINRQKSDKVVDEAVKKIKRLYKDGK